MSLDSSPEVESESESESAKNRTKSESGESGLGLGAIPSTYSLSHICFYARIFFG